MEEVQFFKALNLLPVCVKRSEIWENLIEEELIKVNNIKDCFISLQKNTLKKNNSRRERKKKKKCCIVCESL